MTRTRTTFRPALQSFLAAAALAGGWPVLAGAQIVTGSPQAAALAGNGTMVSRGTRALGVNPALLGVRKRPSFSIALPATSFGATTDPITFKDIKPYQRTVVPHSVAESWLQRITDAGGLRTTAALQGDVLGLSIGPIAASLSAIGEATATLPPELAELLLFGNAGRTGEARDLTITGGAARTWGAGVVSLGFGRQLPLRITGSADESFSLGVTGKYVASPGMAAMVTPSGRITSDPIGSDITVPFLVFNETKGGGVGATGYGLDIGAAWSAGPLALGVTLHDVVNTFRYRIESARVYRGYALATEDSSGAYMEEDLALDDPTVDPAIRARAHDLVKQARFTPTLRVSGAFTPMSWLTVTSDALAHSGSADALTSLPKLSVGLGAEARLLSFLPVRGGVRVGNGYTTLRAGAGLRLFALRIDGAIGTTRGAGAGLDAAVGVTVMGGKF
jgi:hypothetical protein